MELLSRLSATLSKKPSKDQITKLKVGIIKANISQQLKDVMLLMVDDYILHNPHLE